MGTMPKKIKRKSSKGVLALSAQTPAFLINPFGPTQQRTIKKAKVATSVYTLDDGTKLLVKPIISDIRRAVGQFNQENQPLYFLTLGQIINTKAPKKLQKPKSRVP